MGFIDSLRGGGGPLSHDDILKFPIRASIHSFLSLDDLLERFGACLDVSNNGMSLLSAEDIFGDEVADNEAALSYVDASSKGTLAGQDDRL